MEKEQKIQIALAKVSGKIIEDKKKLKNLIIQCKKITYDKQYLKKIILIPGGGSSANLIRFINAQLKISNDLAHWMAILAMDFNADRIHRRFPSLKISDTIEKLKEDTESRIILLKPFQFLYEEDALPHSWDITSDSITLYIAHKLKLSNCFLIKDVAGIYLKDEERVIKEITANEIIKLKKNNKLTNLGNKNENLKKSRPIDEYLPIYIKKFGIDCIFINFGENLLVRFFDESVNKQDLIFTKISHI
ncbi:MAG: hypothetical protein R6U96_05635 [Promethearchaeia archaeon]